MTDSSEYTLRLSQMFKRDIFSIPGSSPSHQIGYTENKNNYLWGTTMLKMTLELQCCCVALIVMTQVWILVYFGSDIFEKLIGDELCLPILYLMAIIFGTLTYVRPTYWRIALSLTVYSVCIYFSVMVTNVAIKILMTPELAGILQREPTRASSYSLRVWIPWATGFALHMQFCITSFFIAIISLRDMYSFNPRVFTGRSLGCMGGSSDETVTVRQSCTIPMQPTLGLIRVVTAAEGYNNGKGYGTSNNSHHQSRTPFNGVFTV